jgi:hypothetical protein
MGIMVPRRHNDGGNDYAGNVLGLKIHLPRKLFNFNSSTAARCSALATSLLRMWQCVLSDQEVRDYIESWKLSQTPSSATPDPPTPAPPAPFISCHTTFALPDVPSQPWWQAAAGGYTVQHSMYAQGILLEYQTLASGPGVQKTVTVCGLGKWTTFNLIVPPFCKYIPKPLCNRHNLCRKMANSTCRIAVYAP